MTFEDIRISRAFPNAIYVRGCTKRGRKLLMRYNAAYNTSLYELYNRPSYYKERAYDRIIEEKIKVIGLESINKEILITALISADFYEDKKYILSKFRGFNKIAIDGFFNFRLDGLKKKWSEICTFIPDFFTEREIKEFVMYLLNEKCARGVKVDGNKVFDKLGNRLNRASLLPNSSLLVFKELLLAGAKEIEIFSLPNDELEQKYLKEYFGDKIFFNSGEILWQNSA